MKKSVLIILFVLVSGLSLNAQDYKTSLGLRAGLPFGFSGVTIRHFLNKYNAVEGIVASNFEGIIATGLFENEHRTGFYPGVNWYWGLGAHIGFWGPGANRYINSAQNYSGGAVMGIDGIFGVEYTFDDIPLNLSVDVLPNVNLFGYPGWNLINGAVSIRYVF
jgi:hypothetical protein